MNKLYSETFKKADGEMILDEIEVNTLLNFINYQIEDPFSYDQNYFKKLKKKYEDDREVLESYCYQIIDKIKDKYPSLDIDLGAGNVNVVDLTDVLYKFFIKNIGKMTYFFLKEFIYNNKNRKNLLTKYSDMKLSSYPKEQYGKKENYIMIIKLNDIIKEILSLDIDMEEFIKYINKSGDSIYIDLFEKYYNDQIIIDKGVYEDIMDLFKDSETYNPTISKISAKLYDNIIQPSLDNDEGTISKFEFVSDTEDVPSDYEDNEEESEE